MNFNQARDLIRERYEFSIAEANKTTSMLLDVLEFYKRIGRELKPSPLVSPVELNKYLDELEKLTTKKETT
jgi:hypothetical protein